MPQKAQAWPLLRTVGAWQQGEPEEEAGTPSGQNPYRNTRALVLHSYPLRAGIGGGILSVHLSCKSPEQSHLQLDSSLGGMSPRTPQPRESRAWHREPHGLRGGTQEQLLSLLGALRASAHPQKCWGLWGGGQALVRVGAGCSLLALGPCSSAQDCLSTVGTPRCLREINCPQNGQ